MLSRMVQHISHTFTPLGKGISIVLLILVSTITFAHTEVVLGQTYPIVETDLLMFIKEKLAFMQEKGEIEKINHTLQENVIRHVLRPTLVKNFTRAVQTKSWYFDPSITTPYDLHDERGNILIRQGTRVNPLKYITIHHPLVFIDGDDKQQVSWFIEQSITKFKNKTKCVLVNGSVEYAANKIGEPVYFDQESRLTARFSIRHVPAIVSQEGALLKIEEIAL